MQKHKLSHEKDRQRRVDEKSISRSSGRWKQNVKQNLGQEKKGDTATYTDSSQKFFSWFLPWFQMIQDRTRSHCLVFFPHRFCSFEWDSRLIADPVQWKVFTKKSSTFLCLLRLGFGLLDFSFLGSLWGVINCRGGVVEGKWSERGVGQVCVVHFFAAAAQQLVRRIEKLTKKVILNQIK